MSDGTMFGGVHPKSGDWETLKGSMLAPHEAAPLESTNSGDARFNGEVTGPQGWEAALKPVEPLTHGGGAMAK